MIPIRLSLQGVFSYVEKQEIDFSSLTAAGLFGIFGRVGSGKSSIVDAITFVLYNNNFRLTHGGMLYNIMNLSSPSMHIEYDFRVGASLYRFSVSAKRRKNNFEETSPQTRIACVWDSDLQEWKPTEKSAQSIIGLSYDDFRRAVIIPQNNFQEFLELKSTDRTEMMQKIFRLDKFDLSSKVKQIKDNNCLLITANNTQLRELGDINQEQVEVLERELNDLEQNIIVEQKRLHSLQSAAGDWSKIKSQQDALVHKENKLRLLADREAEQVARKSTLQAYRKVLINVKPLLDRRDELTQQFSELQKTIAYSTEKQHAKEAEHAAILLGYNEARTAFENRETLRITAEDLEKLHKIRLSTAVIEELATKRSDGERYHRELAEKIEHDKTARVRLLQEMADLDRQEIDIATVTSVLNWFDAMQTFHSQVKSEEESLKNLQAELESRLLRKAHFHNGQLKGIDTGSSPAAIDSAIVSLRQNLEKETKSVRDQEQKILQQKMLLEHIHALRDGEPCPLCGSAEHPAPLAVNMGIEELSLQMLHKIEALENADRQLDELKENWNELKNEISRTEEYIKQSAARLVQLKQTVADEKAKFVWKSFSDVDRSVALKAREQFQLQSERKKLLNADINNLSVVIEQDSDKLLKYQARLQQIVSDIANHSGIISASSRSMAFPPDHYKNESSAGLLAKSVKLKKSYQDSAVQYETLRSQLSKSEVSIAELKTRLEGDKRLLEESRQKGLDLNGEIEKALKGCGFEDLEEVRSLMNSGIDADAWQHQLETYFQDLQQARADVAFASAELDGKTYDEEKHKLIDAEIASLHTELDVLKKRSGALDIEIKTKKSNLLRRLDLLDEQIKLELRAANIQTMEQLFKGKAFVNYASGIYLLNLVNVANVRFQKMTHGQLLLQLDKENGFEVLDLLNDGKIRSVRTLSGGQKFQAALCLALALADGISQGSHENFFFMDEGFGSLDRESMQEVFETLQSLRKENRVVGLISHVDEMQQEMDRYILVHRDETRGSWVEVN